MFGEMLRGVAAAALFGSAAMLLVRGGALREILRIAVGMMIVLAVVRPIVGSAAAVFRWEPSEVVPTAALEETQTSAYWDALAHETEQKIQAYFAEREVEAEVTVQFETGALKAVMIRPAQSYDEMKEGMQKEIDAFTAWSGIPKEKQEWIWNS